MGREEQEDDKDHIGERLHWWKLTGEVFYLSKQSQDRNNWPPVLYNLTNRLCPKFFRGYNTSPLCSWLYWCSGQNHIKIPCIDSRQGGGIFLSFGRRMVSPKSLVLQEAKGYFKTFVKEVTSEDILMLEWICKMPRSYQEYVKD